MEMEVRSVGRLGGEGVVVGHWERRSVSGCWRLHWEEEGEEEVY